MASLGQFKMASNNCQIVDKNGEPWFPYQIWFFGTQHGDTVNKMSMYGKQNGTLWGQIGSV